MKKVWDDIDPIRMVMDAIRKVKTSNYGREVVTTIQAAADDMVERNAQALLVACHDASQILAEALVQYAKKAG